MNYCPHCGKPLRGREFSFCEGCTGKPHRGEDDILPEDNDEVRQGIDKDMVKRITGIVSGVLIIICCCIAVMYLI